MAEPEAADSDSDEYEMMAPNALPDLMKSRDGNGSAEQLQQQDHQEQLELKQQEGQVEHEQWQQQEQQLPKKKVESKKKRLFWRITRGKPDKKTSSTSLTAESSGRVVVAQAVTVKSQTLPMQAPKLGPKPPRRLSEEEMLEQMRQRQKVVVAAARQDRLRRCSESNLPERIHRSQAMEYHPGYTVDKSYGELEVKDILDKYSSHLPLKVLVSKGVYGMEERYSLSTSDKCVIHYIKRRELVQIHDPKTNTEFSVPVNSAIKFGVVYNPHNVESLALKGLQFPYVSDILAETKLPKMGVASLKDPDVIGMKSIEVVVIKEVIFPENRLDPRLLRVYSLTAKCHRDLPETQEVNFHTTPSLMQLYLTDLLKHVPDPCPLHVAMYRNPLGRPLVAPGIPSSMFRRPMYLKKLYTDILLIAASCSEGDSADGGTEAFEIPTDIDVEFEVIKCSAEEKERLGEESKKLKEKLGNVRHHRYSGMTNEQHRMQQSLYKSVREGEGLVQSTEVDDDYVRATSGNRLAMNHRVELLEENMKRCSYSLAEVKATTAAITKENQALTEKVRSLEEMVAEHRQMLVMVETMERQMDMIYTELDALRGQEGPTTYPISGGVVKTQTPPTTEPSRSGGVTETQAMPTYSQDTPTDSQTTPTTTGSDVVAKTESPPTTEQIGVANTEATPTTTTQIGVANTEAPPTTTTQPATAGDVASESNKMMLSRMRKPEVSRLLGSAGLGQYAEKLSSSGVSGDILAECTDEMLEKELGIVSKLHRLKLVRIIEGKAAVEWYQLVD